jgi:predicted nucleic acid-binding Zn ribbon protein
VSWRRASEEGDDLHRVGDALDRAIRGLGGVRASTLDHVFSGWDELVGPQLAAHTTPLSLRATTLVVGVDEPAWATQLRLMSGSLLARLADVAGPGAVTSVEVRVRP